MDAPLHASHRATVTERIAVLLRDQILTGVIQPGVPLREEDLAKEFEVSRHVIREVLRLLAADGLATYSSFKGARVPRLTTSEVREIYRARRFVELGALAERLPDSTSIARIHGEFSNAVHHQEWREAFRLDVAFHSAIVDSIGSLPVNRWHRELCQQLSLAHLISPAFQEEGLTDSVAQHAEIAVALAAGDAHRARSALESHLAHAERLLTEHMDQRSQTPVSR